MTLSEQLMYICHLLMKRYHVGPDPAMDAVQQAYSEIHGKQVKNFYGLWYTAAKRRLIDYLRVASDRRTLQEWEVPITHQVHFPEFEQIHEQLKKRLPSDDYAFFERMRAGQSIAVIAEEIGVSEPTAYKYKKRMIRRCRSILSDDYPLSGWITVKCDTPGMNEDVEMIMPDGSTRKGYRDARGRWIKANGQLMTYAQPTKWRYV